MQPLSHDVAQRIGLNLRQASLDIQLQKKRAAWLSVEASIKATRPFGTAKS